MSLRRKELEPWIQSLHAVVLCGGSGTRLWPLSRQKLPKQFLALGQETSSLLESTLSRLSSLSKKENHWIVASANQKELCLEHLKNFGLRNFLFEPVARNTAPAITWAAWEILKKDPDAIMLVVASDHVIQNVRSFEQTVLDAAQLARNNYFVTIGIQPTFPATGFGYIEKGLPLDGNAQILAPGTDGDLHSGALGFSVRSFREKPNLAAAEQFIRTGKYLWNSGMFVWKAQTFWNAMSHIEPELCQAISQSTPTQLQEIYHRFSNSPIDISFMEQTSHVACVPATFDWNDVGSWASARECFATDESGNSITGDVFVSKTKSSLIHAKDIFVAAVGLDNVAVVATKDAVLVMPLDQCQEVKSIVKHLEQSKRFELL